MNVKDKLKNKRILIWGYGREGKSTEDFLKRSCTPASIDIFEGKREEIDESKYDYIIKSPGIPMHEDNVKYTSQTQLFLEQYKDNVIGITGTKGKSTTSTMLYTVLSECTDRQVLLLGNIGQPCLDYFDEITDDTIVVYEMSCHQLYHTTVSPHIAVLLNLFEEHLDYYETLDRYFLAKSHVALYQSDSDYIYLGDNVPHFDTKGQKTVISPIHDKKYNLSIEGLHNQFNAEFVYKIATERFDCDESKVRESIENFKGLKHRLEYVDCIDGVKYYDDSISTIPEAAISAAVSISNAKTLLIGGMDRGIDYTKLIDFIDGHPEYNYICMYASGKRIYDTGNLERLGYVSYVDDLEQAVEKAATITSAGEAVILSPAAASYGYFKNFEERGDRFAELVRQRGL